MALSPSAAASGRTQTHLSARLAELAKPSLSSAPRAEQAKALGLARAGPGSLLRAGDGLLVDVRFKPGALDAGALRAAGAEVVNVSSPFRTVTVLARPQRLGALARAAGVEALTEVLTPSISGQEGSDGSARPLASSIEECDGDATSEGDLQLKALEARQTFAVDGSGSTVGILSDSFDADSGAPTEAADDVASGDLPGPGNPCGRTAPVDVLEDFADPSSTDEGRAMAQIVHDLAPGAKLAFATAFTSELGFAENIERLARPIAQGGAAADVIVDDVFYFTEPVFQEGPIAVAADTVASEGVAYLSAAGNDNLIDASGRDIASWETPSFRDAPSCPSDLGSSPEEERCLDFDPGGAADNTFGITVSGGETLTVDLQWAEPWNGVASDLDVFLLDSTGKRIKQGGFDVGGFENNPGLSKKPVEVFQWTNGSGGSRQVQLAVVRCFGECNPGAGSSTAPRVKLALLQNGGGVTATEYPESSGGDVVGPTIFGHTAAERTISTGAVPYDSVSEPEYYSSRGPVTHYFGPVEGAGAAPALGSPQTLSKPDLVATDGGANTFFGFRESGTWRFYGTSAAAPHAAAVAALIRDAQPGASPAELRSAMTSTAVPVGAFGPDAVGAGLVDAKAAVGEFAAAPDETPPETQITSGPAEGATINDPTPTFEFSSEPGASFECRLDTGPFVACTSPYAAPTLTDGAHSFEVRATDAADNTDPTPASVSFTVDATAAQTTVTSGPAEGATINDPTPTFEFSSEPGASFECRLDTGPFVACTSPYAAPTLTDGAHSFEVRATDAADNTDPTPASVSFTVDATAAQTTVTSGPAEGATINDPTPTFEFSSEPGASFECRLDTGPFVACTSPYAAPTLTDGAHSFEVRATDAADNTDPTPASVSFTVDAAAAQTTVIPGPPAPEVQLAPPPAIAPALGIAVAARRARVSRDKALVRLSCRRAETCRGLVKLFYRRGRRKVLVGKRSFVVTGRQAIPVGLNGRGRSLLRNPHPRGLKILLRGRGVKHRTVVLLQPATHPARR